MRQSSDTPVLSTFFSEQVIEGVMPFHIVEFCSAEAKLNLSQDLKVDGCKIKPYDGRWYMLLKRLKVNYIFLFGEVIFFSFL